MDDHDPSRPPHRPPAWDDAWERAWERGMVEHPGCIPVRVVRIDKGGITVADSPGGARLVVAAKAARRVVVGDVCALDPDTDRIEAILPRRTVFERRAPGASRNDVAAEAKALAANMDIVLVLQPLDGGVNPQRLAREMVLAWESGARPVVVLTKSDTVGAEELARCRRDAARFAPGVAVVGVGGLVSAEATDSPPGVSDLLGHLPGGSVSVLLGASGAGKSTLANVLAGHPVQLTREVREGDRRGRHTTTAGQMIALRDDRWLIDTPGIRGVGLWHADEGLERAFADLAPFAERCQFGDCAHGEEPGCGVTEAVASGEVGEDRLDAWRALVAEIEALEARTELRDREHVRAENQRSRYRASRRSGPP